MEHIAVSLSSRRRLTHNSHNISNDNAFGPEDAIERSVRQRHDLRLIAEKKYDTLFTQYIPVIQVTCKMRGLHTGETLEVTAIVCERMWKEFERKKDFSRVSVYGSFVWKARWEAAGARERRAGVRNEELTEPAIIAQLAEVAVDDIYPSVTTGEHEELYSAMEQLSEKQLLVVELLYLEDLTVAEVAEYMGAKANAISQLKFNALKKLAFILGA